MSLWTYVDGMVEIDTYSISKAVNDYKVYHALEHMPQITGSERNASVRVVQFEDKMFSLSDDCDEYGRPSNLGKRWCGGSKNFSFETDTTYFVLIHGNLRDREMNQTVREVSKFLCRLASSVWVKNVLIRISDHERDYIINDVHNFFSSIDSNDPYKDMKITD